MLIYLSLPDRLAGPDVVEGVGLCEGQDPPQGPSKHLQLVPNTVVLRGTLALHSSTAALLSSF